MPVVARGTVQDRPWGRTLSFVADRRFSGELVVDLDGRRYVVGFDDGAVVAAASPLATDAAVRVALTAGLVTSSHVAEINRQVAAQPDLDEVDAVAGAARLGPDQTDRLRRRVIAHKAIRGFALERGDFVLTDDRTLAFSADHAIDVRALIYLGARSHMTEQRLLQELARVGPGFQLRHEAIATLPQYGFSEAEKPVLAALRAAPIAVLDLDAAATELDPRTVRAVVYALAVTNALEIAQSSVGNDRPRKPTPPAQVATARRTGTIPASQLERVRKPSSVPGGRPSESSSERRRRQTEGGFETRTPSKPITIPNLDRSRQASSSPALDAPTARAVASSRGKIATHPGIERSKTGSEPAATRSAVPIPLPGADDSGGVRGKPASQPPTYRGSRAAAATGAPGSVRGRAATGPAFSTDETSEVRRAFAAEEASYPGDPRSRSSSQVFAYEESSRPGDPRSPSIDSRAHRRPTRRSTLHHVNIPVAGEVRALIRDRSALSEQGADHFALLGVTPDSGPDLIRKVYFGLARQLHPDRLTALGISDEDRQAQRLFAQINTAFAVLSSPARRADYRRTLSAGGEGAVRAEEDRAEAMTRKILAAEEKFRIGEMALRRDQLDVALAHFKEAVALNPEEADHHALLGWTLFVAAPDKTMVTREAKGLLEKAMRISPKAVAPRLYLGRMARMLGQDKGAIAMFNEVLALAPGHAEATSELRVLEARQPREPDGKGRGLFGRSKK